MKNRNDNGEMLLLFGLIIIMAACPPIGVILMLCIAFSDGTLPGFIGCLTPFVILVIIALLTMAFQ